VLHVLSRSGSDVSGSLILGDPAYEHWQSNKVAPPEPLKPRALGRAYARLAEHAVAAGVAGSSAAGEFPKFCTARTGGQRHTPCVGEVSLGSMVRPPCSAGLTCSSANTSPWMLGNSAWLGGRQEPHRHL